MLAIPARVKQGGQRPRTAVAILTCKQGKRMTLEMSDGHIKLSSRNVISGNGASPMALVLGWVLVEDGDGREVRASLKEACWFCLA